MKKQVIIQCVNCYTHSEDFAFINHGFAYQEEDLESLFTNNHICPFCQTTLYITPTFIESFLELKNKKFDIHIAGNLISTSEGQYELLSDTLKHMVTTEKAHDRLNAFEIEMLSFLIDEFDKNKWTILIQTQ
ncbi:hypothetical protein [Alkalibacillus salilacus]|uniref:hypothetical protein n=1 Tax=Alkalibacillus salilacus TaxID=284582 RepID=UPI0027D871A8|nr:hypothetical protein [Alkalibacillus salilacus]